MKEKTDLKTVVAFLMAILIFSAPILIMAQQAEIGEELQSEMQEALAAAERDAQANTSGCLWFVAGCFGGVLGLIIAYVYTPSPPASKFIGKSPEYVAYYTDFYQSKAKSIQTKQTWTGCIVSGIANCVLTIVYVAVIAAAEDW